jgi:ankyrin repeat protein
VDAAVMRCVAAMETDDAEALAAALDAAPHLEVDGAVDGGGRTLLHFTGPGWRCVAHLLYRGARADVLADDGGTALTHAARRGHRDAAAALLAWGAQVGRVPRGRATR